jgi:hypothetical protein
MFLCKECGVKRGYDSFLWSFFISWGPCEDCGKVTDCKDL